MEFFRIQILENMNENIIMNIKICIHAKQNVITHFNDFNTI
jgi:hypothetical protein